MASRCIYLISLVGSVLFPSGLAIEVECPSPLLDSMSSTRTLIQAKKNGNQPILQMVSSQVQLLSSSSKVHSPSVHATAILDIAELSSLPVLLSQDTTVVVPVGATLASSPALQTGVVLSLFAFLAVSVNLVHSVFSGGTATYPLSVGFLYIYVSTLMIQTNKWLMLPGRFPYSFGLAALHMLSSLVFSLCLRSTCPWTFPSLRTNRITPLFCAKFFPIGLAFAVTLVCGNYAYKYLSVQFLQVLKQCNVVIIYALSLLVGLETWRRCSAALLASILFSTVLAVHGELKFDLVGFLLQVVSSSADACKIVIAAVLMSGTSKVDPLTMVLFLAPCCLVSITPVMLIIEGPYLSEMLTQFRLHWVVIVGNCALAFVLNIIVAACIKQMSPIGYMLCAIVKNVFTVIASAIVFGESLTPTQIVGFTAALVGIALYSLHKQNLDCFEDDELVAGFRRVTAKLARSQSDVPEVVEANRKSATSDLTEHRVGSTPSH